jgi:hypothetical protein
MGTFGVQRPSVGVAAGLAVASPAAKPLANTCNAQGAASDSPPKQYVKYRPKPMLPYTGWKPMPPW